MSANEDRANAVVGEVWPKVLAPDAPSMGKLVELSSLIARALDEVGAAEFARGLMSGANHDEECPEHGCAVAMGTENCDCLSRRIARGRDAGMREAAEIAKAEGDHRRKEADEAHKHRQYRSEEDYRSLASESYAICGAIDSARTAPKGGQG